MPGRPRAPHAGQGNTVYLQNERSRCAGRAHSFSQIGASAASRQRAPRDPAPLRFPRRPATFAADAVRPPGPGGAGSGRSGGRGAAPCSRGRRTFPTMAERGACRKRTRPRGARTQLCSEDADCRAAFRTPFLSSLLPSGAGDGGGREGGTAGPVRLLVVAWQEALGRAAKPLRGGRAFSAPLLQTVEERLAALWLNLGLWVEAELSPGLCRRIDMRKWIQGNLKAKVLRSLSRYSYWQRWDSVGITLQKTQ